RVEREILSARVDLVGDLHGAGVDGAKEKRRQAVACIRCARVARIERAERERPGRSAVANLGIRAGSELSTELVRVRASGQRQRIENLSVGDGRLKPTDRGAAERRVA